MWADRGQGLSKFRVSVMAALTHHLDAYDAGDLGTTDLLVAVRLQAHDMMVERHAATAAAMVLLLLLLQLLGTATTLISTKVFEELAPSLCSRRN